MSRRRGGRNGVSVRVANDVAGRLHDIRALWLAIQNDPSRSVTDLAPEFYFIVGELLEGKTLPSVTLRHIDRVRVDAHAKD